MKILNLYAGIGGNRKLWPSEHEVTAIENVPYIAEAYRKLFPQDTVIEADAHQYLPNYFKEFDFIWSSPPCPTHSKMNTTFDGRGIPLKYPDMTLYQEVIFLKHFYYGKFAVENVIGYYKPLLHPAVFLDRHYIWSNFYIPPAIIDGGPPLHTAGITALSAHYDIQLPRGTLNHRKLLRNCTDPEVGLHILNAALKETKQEVLL